MRGHTSVRFAVLVRALLLASLLVLAAPVSAGMLLPVGVVGNSGEAGATVVRVGPYTLDSCASGVLVDSEYTLWASGGEALHRYTLSGRLSQRIPLAPPGSHVDSRTFAELEGALYFTGRLPDGGWAIFRYPLRGASEASALDLPLPRLANPGFPYVLAPQALDGLLYVLVWSVEEEPGQFGLYRLDPRLPSLERAFSLTGFYPSGLAADPEQGVLYVGANFGMFIGGETHPSVAAITCVRPDGTPVSDAFPAVTTKTPATPTQFRGRVSSADGALWDTAWYGFLSRLNREARPDPGRVIQWHHDLGYTTQIAGLADRNPSGDLGRGLLAITTAAPDALYVARWDRGRQALELVTRIGSLRAHSVGLSADGWITAGSDRCQYWWRWEDGPAAVPRKAGLHLALTPGFFHGEEFFTLAAQYNIRGEKYTPLAFGPRVFGNNEGRRTGPSVPLQEPRGLSPLLVPGEHNARLLVSDADTRALWEARIHLGNLTINPDSWQQLPLAPGVALAAPGDLVVFQDGKVLLADGGSVRLLEPTEDGLRPLWTLTGWGDRPEDRFGPRLRLAASGEWLLVSDTERHRVLWFDWPAQRLLGQLGRTDQAGSGWWELDQPGPLSVQGARAVVADLGNERILKLELLPD